MDKPKYTTKKNLESKEIPKGLWQKCSNCAENHTVSHLENNFFICEKCGCHLTMPIAYRIESLCDQGSFKELFKNYQSVDPLNFTDGKTTYLEKLKSSQAATHQKEAIITGQAKMHGKPVVLAIMEFKFIGGSMGAVVGEKIYQSMKYAIKKKSAFIAITASGGARMQEGLISLVQMAKTCVGAQEMNEKAIPFITVLTNPTMGGVTASFASVADIIIAEPGAAIGFAGRRVIEDTIKEKLPENFQTSEYLHKGGFVDLIVNRTEIKHKITEILEILAKK